HDSRLKFKSEGGLTRRPVLLWRRRQDRLKRSDDGRVELAFNCLRKAHSSNPTWHRIAVGPVRGHRVVGVGDGNDPREQWNASSDKAVRIPVTIHTLMVMPDY